MNSPIALDSRMHKNLRIDIRPSATYGDHVNRTLAFTTEFGELHKELPILFHKDPESGAYHAHAILGLDADENLFVDDHEWLCNYVPAMLARGPFLIGAQDPSGGAGEQAEPVILIDRDDQRVGVHDGQPLFLDSGDNSPYLENVLRSLRIIHHGATLDKEFYSCLESMDLLEPVSIKATLSNIEQVHLHSYHTINEDKLAELDGESLKRLNSLGLLGHIFYALSSLGNVRKLIEMKNRKAALA